MRFGVCDHDNGSARSRQFGEHFHHGITIGGVEIACGLVGQNYLRISHKRTCNRDSLLLATRKLTGHVLRPV